MLLVLCALAVVDVAFPLRVKDLATVVWTRSTFVTYYIARPLGVAQSGVAVIPSVARDVSTTCP